jgi:uncharacterized protein YgiM (DUF1202 family)
MRASLGDESAPLLQEASNETISIATIKKGEEFEIGKVIRQKKGTWVTITLDNGVTGFISGDTHIFAIQKVEAMGNDLEIYEEPDSSSAVLTTIPKKTLFTVRGVEKVDDQTWYRVESPEGIKGYMLSGPRLRTRPEVTAASARKMMITGGIFTAVGVLLYFLLPSATETGGGDTSFITLAVILLGFYQLLQGYLQYRQVKKEQENK